MNENFSLEHSLYIYIIICIHFSTDLLQTGELRGMAYFEQAHPFAQILPFLRLVCAHKL